MFCAFENEISSIKKFFARRQRANVRSSRAEKYVENVSNVEKNLDKALQKLCFPAKFL